MSTSGDTRDIVDELTRRSHAFIADFGAMVDAARKQLEIERAQLDDAKRSFERRVETFEETVRRGAIVRQQSESRVIINVGGLLFETSVFTLTRYPESLLAVLFAGDFPVDRDERGNVFVDRSPKHFGYILEFLRAVARGDIRGPMHVFHYCIEAVPEAELRYVLDEASFYGLTELSDALLEVRRRTQLKQELKVAARAEIGAMVLTFAVHAGLLYSGTADGGLVTVYSLPKLPKINQFVAHSDFVTGLLVHGNVLVTSSRDKTVKVWSLGTFTCLAVAAEHTEFVQGICAHRGEIVSVSQDKSMKLWSISPDTTGIGGGGGDVIAAATHSGGPAPLTSVITMWFESPCKCVASDGNLCFIGSGSRIEVVDPQRGIRYASLVAPTSAIRCIAVSRRTSEVICGTWDQKLICLPISGVRMDRLAESGIIVDNPLTGRTFSSLPNWVADIQIYGNLAVIASDITVFVFNLETLKVIRELRTTHRDIVRCVALDLARTILICGSFDGTLQSFVSADEYDELVLGRNSGRTA